MSEETKLSPEALKKDKPRKRGWRRVWGWTWKSLLGLLLFVVALPFLLLLGWQVKPVRSGLISIGLSVASNFLEGKLEVEDLGGNLWSSLEVKNARWYSRDKKLMAGLVHLRVRYDLMHFLSKGELLVEEVHLKGPEGHLGINAKGQLDLLTHIKTGDAPKKKPKPPPKPSTGGASFQLRVKKVVVVGLNASFRPGPKARPIGVKDLRLETDYTLKLKGMRMKAQIKHLSFKASNPDVDLKKLTLAFWMKGDDLGVNNLHLKFGQHSEIRLDAALALTKVLGLNVNLSRLYVHPDDLRPIVPGLPLQKPVTATLQAKGSLADLAAKLKAQAGKAKITLTASSGGLKKQTYDATLAVTDVDLKELLGKPDLHSQLSLELTAKGQGFSATTDGVVNLTIKPGHFQKKYRFQKIQIQAVAKDGVATVNTLRLRTSFGRLSGRAKVAYLKGSFDAFLAGNFPRLGRIGDLVGQQLRGRLSLRAWIKGEKWQPKARALVTLKAFRYYDPKFRRWRSQAKLFRRWAQRYQRAWKKIRPGKLALAKQGVARRPPPPKVHLDRRCLRLYRRAHRRRSRSKKKKAVTASPATVLQFCARHYGELAETRRKQGLPVAQVQRLRVNANLLDLAPSLRATVSLRGSGIRAGGQHVRRLGLKARAEMDPKAQVQKVWLSQFSYDLGFGTFRLEKRAFLQVEQGARATIRRLWWRNGSQRLRVDARFDWKRWRQDVHLQIMALRIGPLVRALGVMPEQALKGVVALDVKARGSFAYPRLRVRLGLKSGRFEQFDRLDSRLALDYQWTRKQRRKLVLNFRAERRSANGQIQRLASLAVDLPARINLEQIALKGNTRYIVLPRKAFRVKVDVPGLDLGWLGKKIKLPQLQGFVAASIQLDQTLRDPRLDMSVTLRKAGWGAYKAFDTDLYVAYRRGELRLSKIDPATKKQIQSEIKLNGRKLVVMGGRLPLLLEVRQRRGQLVPRTQLLDRPMAFSLYFSKQRLDWLLDQLVPALGASIAHLHGVMSGFLLLRGKPSRPRVDFSFSLEEGSFCPLTEDGFACYEQVGFDEKGDYRFRKTGDITQTVRKARSLRVKGLAFALDFHYAPPTATTSSGRVRLNTRLAIGKHLLLAVGKYAQPNRKCKFGNEPLKSGPLPVEIAMNLGLNPATYKPTFVLFDPVRLNLQVPTVEFQTIAKWVQLPVMKKLKGELMFDLSVCHRLSNPDLKVITRLGKVSYQVGENADGSPQVVDKAGFELNLDLRENNVGSYMQAWALGKRIFDSTAMVRGIHVGLDPKTLQVSQKQMGTYVYANLRIPGFDLSQLARRIGMADQMYGVIKGDIELRGDPACPVLGTPTKGNKVRNHITIDNLYLGIPRKLFLQKRKKKVPLNKIAALSLRRFRIALHSITQNSKLQPVQDGRLKLDMGMWRSRNPETKQPDMLVAHVRYPLPLSLVPLSAQALVKQKRCSHWPKGRPSSKISANISRNLYPLSLRFVEAFVPGLRFDVILDASAKVLGSLDKIKYAKGYVNLRIKSIAMEEYGLNILTNLNDSRLRKKNYLLYKRCQDIRNNKFRNKETKVLDMHVPGCAYSYIQLSLDPKAYRLEGRLQGTQGKPLLLYGGIPRLRFGLDISPSQACSDRSSDVYFSVKCTRERKRQAQKKMAFYVRSTNFQPMATPRHRLVLKTSIDIAKAWNTPLRITGEVRIPDMLFTLPETSRSAKDYAVHKDMVLLGRKQGANSEMRLRPEQKKQGAKKKKKPRRRRRRRRRSKQPGMVADLKIVIPRGARVRNREMDFTARTEEFRDLNVKLSGDVLRLIGGVEVVRGEITLYTKKFTVQSGSRVTFMGQSLSLDELGQLNARLQISAIHTLSMPKGSSLAKRGHGRVNVLLKVGGTIQGIQIDLEVRDASSDQRISMDKANVLTLILTGSTTDDLAGGQQANLSGQALGVFSKFASAQIRNSLSEVVPIDVLKIETGARAEDLKIEIGKYFTKWLYGQILYKPVPIEEEDLWEVLLDLALTRRWSLEVRFGHRKRNNAFLLRGSTHFFFRIKR